VVAVTKIKVIESCNWNRFTKRFHFRSCVDECQM